MKTAAPRWPFTCHDFGKMYQKLQPLPKPCPVKLGLLKAWVDSTDDYGKLAQQAPGTPTITLKTAAVRCLQARKNFDEHCVDHRC